MKILNSCFLVFLAILFCGCSERSMQATPPADGFKPITQESNSGPASTSKAQPGPAPELESAPRSGKGPAVSEQGSDNASDG